MRDECHCSPRPADPRSTLELRCITLVASAICLSHRTWMSSAVAQRQHQTHQSPAPPTPPLLSPLRLVGSLTTTDPNGTSAATFNRLFLTQLSRAPHQHHSRAPNGASQPNRQQCKIFYAKRNIMDAAAAAIERFGLSGGKHRAASVWWRSCQLSCCRRQQKRAALPDFRNSVNVVLVQKQQPCENFQRRARWPKYSPQICELVS